MRWYMTARSTLRSPFLLVAAGFLSLAACSSSSSPSGDAAVTVGDGSPSDTHAIADAGDGATSTTNTDVALGGQSIPDGAAAEAATASTDGPAPADAESLACGTSPMTWRYPDRGCGAPQRACRYPMDACLSALVCLCEGTLVGTCEGGASKPWAWSMAITAANANSEGKPCDPSKPAPMP
jgi:hypothetical protein